MTWKAITRLANKEEWGCYSEMSTIIPTAKRLGVLKSRTKRRPHSCRYCRCKFKKTVQPVLLGTGQTA